MTDLGIAAESLPDARLIEGLADRLLVEGIDWIEETAIADYRTWRGIATDPYLDIHGAWERARQRFGQSLYGSFQGEPKALEAQMYRAILFLFADEETPPSVVVISRDVDGEDERKTGFRQAIAEKREYPFRCIIGALADPEIEAWIIAAWSPEDDGKKKTLATVRKALGFDPTLKPEKLTSRKRNDKKDAKRVLDKLCERGRRGQDRWRDAEIQRLRDRGQECGLAQFIYDVRNQLVPVLAKP